MALFTAVGLGGLAAVAIPTILVGHEDVLGGVLNGEVSRIPIAGGFNLHWSPLIFAFTTLVIWAALKASEQR